MCSPVHGFTGLLNDVDVGGGSSSDSAVKSTKVTVRFSSVSFCTEF